MAAGFSLLTENLGQFKERLFSIADDQLSGKGLYPFLSIDVETPLSAINGETYKLIERFAPFGSGNPLPCFLSPGVRVIEYYTVGSESRHLKLKLRQGDIVWRGIGFDLGNLVTDIASEVDLVYNLTIDQWRGESTLALNILDFAPASYSGH